MTTRRILGVDVGNSKTHVAVAEGDRIVAGALGPGVTDGFVTPDDILGLVRRLLTDAGAPTHGYDAACYAVAGLDLPEQEAAFLAACEEDGAAARTAALNDVFALLRTGPDGEGVAVVAGAGINCVGVRGDTHVRYHSFGELSGDWGGGGDVGRAALAAACRAEDGRGPATVLAERIAAHFGQPDALAVSREIVLGRVSGARLVDLAPLVFAAAVEDAAAAAIVDRLADEVVAFVAATRTRLGWDEDSRPLPVLLGGGLLRSGDDRLLSRIRTGVGPGAAVSIASVPPVVGSVMLAYDLLEEAAPPSAELAGQFERALA